MNGEEIIKISRRDLSQVFKRLFLVIHRKLVEYGIQSTFVQEITKEIMEGMVVELGLDIKDCEERMKN